MSNLVSASGSRSIAGRLPLSSSSEVTLASGYSTRNSNTGAIRCLYPKQASLPHPIVAPRKSCNGGQVWPIGFLKARCSSARAAGESSLANLDTILSGSPGRLPLHPAPLRPCSGEQRLFFWVGVINLDAHFLGSLWQALTSSCNGSPEVV